MSLICTALLLLFPGNSLDGAAVGNREPLIAVGQYDVIGRMAPDFKLHLIGGKGKELTLSSLRGKAVVISFWATWSEPSKVEMPWLVDLKKKYGPNAFEIVGVALDDTDEITLETLTRKMQVNYPIVIGNEKVADLYGGIRGLPMLFFVDRCGRIVARELGLRSVAVLEDHVKQSLQETCDSHNRIRGSAK